MRAIATQLGVHPSTVSRALDPAKQQLVSSQIREQVAALARELGYRPDFVARSLRRQETRTIGVIVADFGNPFIAPVIHSLTQTVAARGVTPLIAETEDDPERLRMGFESLLSRRVDAIVLTAARSGDRPFVERMATQVPLVLAVRSLPGNRVPSVVPDDRHGGKLVAEHLVQEAGHAFVAELRGPGDASSFVERSAGFRHVVVKSGAHLVEVPEEARHPVVEEGARLMRLLLDRAPRLPIGVFAHNDLMALGALDAIRAASLRCPDDVALVGYNNGFFLEHVSPTVTSVEFPGVEIGALTGNLALDVIAGQPLASRRLMVRPRLIVRASTFGAGQ